MDPLSRLFGSPARLKLLRLFYFNDDTAYPMAEAAFRAKIPDAAARKEIALLITAGVVKKKTVKSGTVYEANKKFAYYDQLLTFLRTTTSVRDADVVDYLRKAGALRAVVLAGVFTGSMESKIDILVVGDALNERALKAAIHTIEAELGRELRYAAFTTPDFRYRMGVYDRLIRDVLDYSHRAVLDKLGLKA